MHRSTGTGVVIYNVDFTGSGSLSQVGATVTSVGGVAFTQACRASSDLSFSNLAFAVWNGKALFHNDIL